MICECAACGESMNATQYAVITPVGLVNNLCSDECIKIYNNADLDLDQQTEVKNE